MNVPRSVLIALLVVFAVAALAALFMAYQHPAMLLDFSNLMFCG